MTLPEFSNQFDVLYNNISSNQAPGLDEYEKSLFLTKAQSDLIKEYFNNKLDGSNNGFDGSQKRQYDFSRLMRIATLFNVNSIDTRVDTIEMLDKRSKIFLFPPDYFLSVNEIASDSMYQYSVLPIQYAEYQRLMLKPYAYPIKKQVWRLFTNKKDSNYAVELLTVNNTPTAITYEILSTWADQRRNLQLTILVQDSPHIGTTEVLNENGCVIKYTDNSYYAVSADNSWSDNVTYNIELVLSKPSGINVDDKLALQILQAALYKYIPNKTYPDGDMYNAAVRLDCLQLSSAPSHFYNFRNTGGKTFTTEVIELPYAEIIGKFKGTVNYQLRYIKKPTPIILDDLDNGVTIGGLNVATECILPSEMHQEIVERAVTLAKIAYVAGTTETLAGQKSNKE